MTKTPRPPIAGGRRRRALRLVFAGAATLAMFALYDAAQPGTPETVLGSGSVRLTDTDVSPQAPPGLTGGGFAADDDDDQAQLQQQLQQSMQQAEQQNEQAQQQFNQDMQQQQTYENQFNNP